MTEEGRAALLAAAHEHGRKRHEVSAESEALGAVLADRFTAGEKRGEKEITFYRLAWRTAPARLVSCL